MTKRHRVLNRAILLALLLAISTSLALVGAQPVAASPAKGKAQFIAVAAAYPATSCAVPDVSAALRRGRPVRRAVGNFKITQSQLLKMRRANIKIKLAYPAVGKVLAANPLLAKPKMKPVVRASFAPAIPVMIIAFEGYEAYAAGGAAALGVLWCVDNWDTFSGEAQEAWDKLVQAMRDLDKQGFKDWYEAWLIWSGLAESEYEEMVDGEGSSESEGGSNSNPFPDIDEMN